MKIALVKAICGAFRWSAYMRLTSVQVGTYENPTPVFRSHSRDALHLSKLWLPDGSYHLTGGGCVAAEASAASVPAWLCLQIPLRPSWPLFSTICLCQIFVPASASHSGVSTVNLHEPIASMIHHPVYKVQDRLS